jgi:hypothetical protein
MSGMAHQAQGPRGLLVGLSLRSSRHLPLLQQTRGREQVACGRRSLRFDRAANSEPK